MRELGRSDTPSSRSRASDDLECIEDKHGSGRSLQVEAAVGEVETLVADREVRDRGPRRARASPVQLWKEASVILYRRKRPPASVNAAWQTSPRQPSTSATASESGASGRSRTWSALRRSRGLLAEEFARSLDLERAHTGAGEDIAAGQTDTGACANDASPPDGRSARRAPDRRRAPTDRPARSSMACAGKRCRRFQIALGPEAASQNHATARSVSASAAFKRRLILCRALGFEIMAARRRVARGRDQTDSRKPARSG